MLLVLLDILADVALGLGEHEVALELLQGLKPIENMRSREEGIGANTLWIAEFLRVPASHVLVASKETLLQTRLAGKIAFAPVLIAQTERPQVRYVSISGGQSELYVQILVTLLAYLVISFYACKSLR